MKVLTASVIAKTPVVAAHSDSFTEYLCLDCNKSSVLSTLDSPYCPTCGSEDTVKLAAFSDTSALELVHSHDCKLCKQPLSIAAKDSGVVQASMYCILCGESSAEPEPQVDTPKDESKDTTPEVDAEPTPSDSGTPVPEAEAEAVTELKQTVVEDNTEVDHNVTVAFDGSNYAVFQGSKVVATIKKDDVSDTVAEIYGTDAFIPALQAALRVKDTAGYGLKRISITVDDDHVARKLKDAKKEISNDLKVAKDEMAKSREDMKANFKQAVAIAAAGQLSGEFKRPLFTAFEKELTALGIGNAQSIVTRLVAQYGTEQQDILIDEASKLMDMTTEERNELAKKLSTNITAQTASLDVANAVAKAVSTPVVASVAAPEKLGNTKLFPLS